SRTSWFPGNDILVPPLDYDSSSILLSNWIQITDQRNAPGLAKYLWTGLPMVITIIGGIAASHPHSWKDIIQSTRSPELNAVWSVLEENSLPEDCRQCLRDLSIFRQNKEIPFSILHSWWKHTKKHINSSEVLNHLMKYQLLDFGADVVTLND